MMTLNSTRATAVRLLTPYRGVWCADVDLDPEVPTTPSGPAVLTIGENPPLRGTIDAKASGIFAGKPRARVLGGGGGWDDVVPPLHWHSDAGVLDSAVMTATGAAVGEVVSVLAPRRLGNDYVRSAGAASRVFADVDWYVDPTTGTTIVGPRTPKVADPASVEVMTWDPLARRAELRADGIVAPGTVLVDPRFGTATVRDIEQTFTADKPRAIAWCGEEAQARLLANLRTLIAEMSGATFLKHYRYRVIAQGADGRLTVQPVKAKGSVPPAVAITVWPGAAGVAPVVAPGTEVIVGFLEGDPAQPYVHAFATATPPAAKPVAHAPEIVAWATQVAAVCAAAVQPIVIPPLSPSVASTTLFAE